MKLCGESFVIGRKETLFVMKTTQFIERFLWYDEVAPEICRTQSVYFLLDT